MDVRARRRRRERGAALVVSLLLLSILTLLAISGLTAASLELRMAGNEQYLERAFQAADAGIERAIRAAIWRKPWGHGLADGERETVRGMSQIGG